MTQIERIERNITCPYCGDENTDSWEVRGLQNDGESIDDKCGNCGKKFHIVMNVDVTYTTTGLCTENNQEHFWEQFDFVSDTGKRCKGQKCLLCNKYEFDRDIHPDLIIKVKGDEKK